MRNRLQVALGIVLAVLLLASVTRAQTDTATTVMGKVVSVDTTGRTFVVETSTGRVTYKIDDQSMFMAGDRTTDLGDVMVGDQVRVTYRSEGPNKLVTHVHVEGTGKAPAVTAKTTALGTTVTGKVTSIDPATRMITIETPTGNVTYTTTTESRFMSGTETVYIDDVHVGDRVRLTYSGEGSDRVATRVDVLGSAPTTTGRLPATASPFPLIGLVGFLMVAAALGLKAVRARTARA